MTATRLSFAAYLLAALVLLSPSYGGPFLSDDLTYISHNPYVQELSLENLLEILDPFGAATIVTFNYSPVHTLLTALEVHLFGDFAPPYHITNVVLHALSSMLLVLLLLRTGLPRGWALVAGWIFLLHPANVEAVVWASQLKSDVALLLALGALLLEPRRPLWATVCFALSLLSKAMAAFALPVALVFAWQGRARGETPAARWRWLAVWGLVFVGFAAVEFPVFSHSNSDVPPLHPDPLVAARTIVANAMRYLVMAATSYGVSAFHAPQPAVSWLDPWWLSGLLALALLGARTLSTLRRDRPEAAWWVWAAVSYVPVSQVFPFTYPTADRYLYFILPGLLGGALWALHGLFEARVPEDARRGVLRGAAAAAALWIAAFGVHTSQRAALWVSQERLAIDAALHFPDGVHAHLLRSQTAARRGDAETAARELLACFERGYREFGMIAASPAWAPVMNHPTFRAALGRMAQWRIDRTHAIASPTQGELVLAAEGHVIRDELEQSIETFERALEVGGPLEQRIRASLAALRARVAREARAAAAAPGSGDGSDGTGDLSRGPR